MSLKKEEETVSYQKPDKVYAFGAINKIRVGMCQIHLSDTVVTAPDGTKKTKQNNPVTVYDTAGPYSDPSFEPVFRNGIPRIREFWNGRRKDIIIQEIVPNKMRREESDFPQQYPVYIAKPGKPITQMYYAKKRIITPEVEYVAIRENQQMEALGLKSYITPDFVRKEVAAGRAVIPANINHPEVEPMIIGNRFMVKVNTNIMTDNNAENSVHQMINLCEWGSDMLTDLSSHKHAQPMREWLLRNCPVPIGVSPLYQAFIEADEKVENLNWEIFRETLIRQAEQGVDFMFIPAAMRRKHLRLIDLRLTDLVSYSGNILCKWMKKRKEENFLYTHFDDICEILQRYDIMLILGSGLRPGSIYDSFDHAQQAEMGEMRNLIEKAWDHYVQIIAEGLGHVPLHKIKSVVKEYMYIGRGAPVFVMGTIPVDIAGQHDAIASAIGSAQVAWLGASVIGGNTAEDYMSSIAGKEKINIIAHKIAAHAADLAKEHPGAQIRDNALCKARKEGRDDDFRRLVIEP
ncbi:MAG: phosphomethylpyrimidine synthase ThiC [Tannerella sp.]|jgi:phosphomethylpyrimidine synthase|nr:phosphomethylpyrimidine synthase ThiC [Tannerella sp.]